MAICIHMYICSSMVYNIIAVGDFNFHTSRRICCSQLRELWFIDFITYMYIYLYIYICTYTCTISYLLTLVPDGMRGIRNILFEKAAAAVLTSCVRPS